MNAGEPYRILLVDDDTSIAKIIAISLYQLGALYTLDHVLSAEDALDLWNLKPYDIILTDYNLRGTNGVSMLHTIREQGSSVPAILFTAFDTPKIRLEAKSALVSAYLPKPFLIDEIVSLTRSLLNIDIEGMHSREYNI